MVRLKSCGVGRAEGLSKLDSGVVEVVAESLGSEVKATVTN